MGGKQTLRPFYSDVPPRCGSLRLALFSRGHLRGHIALLPRLSKRSVMTSKLWRNRPIRLRAIFVGLIPPHPTATPLSTITNAPTTNASIPHANSTSISASSAAREASTTGSRCVTVYTVSATAMQ